MKYATPKSELRFFSLALPSLIIVALMLFIGQKAPVGIHDGHSYDGSLIIIDAEQKAKIYKANIAINQGRLNSIKIIDNTETHVIQIDKSENPDGIVVYNTSGEKNIKISPDAVSSAIDDKMNVRVDNPHTPPKISGTPEDDLRGSERQESLKKKENKTTSVTEEAKSKTGNILTGTNYIRFLPPDDKSVGLSEATLIFHPQAIPTTQPENKEKN